MSRDTRAHVALVAAAFLFGSTFVVVRDAIRDVGPVPFLAVRFAVATAVSWPLARRQPATPGWTRAGLWCGLAVLAGYLLQTFGLQYTTTSRSAFITYMLVPIVPVLSAVFLRRRPSGPTMAGIGLAVAGLFLLSGATLAPGRGELLTLGCAMAFAVQVVLLAELAPRHDTLSLNTVQVAVVAGACALPGAFLGGYAFTLRAWLAAAYTGVAASAVGFALQVWGQRRVGPSRTALLLAMEPVFAAVAGHAVGERLGATGLGGAGLILAGVVVAEGAPALRAGLRSRGDAGGGEHLDATRPD